MSKAVKFAFIISFVLVFISLGLAVWMFVEKNKLNEVKVKVEQQLNQAQDREKKNLGEIKKLNNQVKILKDDKSILEKNISKSERQVSDLLARVDEISAARDKWKGRLDELRKDRDELMAKLREKPKVIYKEREPEPKKAELVVRDKPVKVVPPPPRIKRTLPAKTYDTPSTVDEQYWASLVKDKASLEVKLDSLSGELSQKSIELVEIKQINADLQIELDSYKHDKDEILQEIQFKEAMLNSIALELARAKNDKKFVSHRVDQLNQENNQLRSQLKLLSSGKGALEKSIIRLSRDREELIKKLQYLPTNIYIFLCPH